MRGGGREGGEQADDEDQDEEEEGNPVYRLDFLTDYDQSGQSVRKQKITPMLFRSRIGESSVLKRPKPVN